MSPDDGYSCSGRVVSGRGEAAFFTRLGWVVEQCREKAGFAPAPGTLNLTVAAKVAKLVDELAGSGPELVPDDPKFCAARIIPARIGTLPAAVVVPDPKVRDHGPEIIEVIAPVNLRRALGKADGDRLEIKLLPPAREKERNGKRH